MDSEMNALKDDDEETHREFYLDLKDWKHHVTTDTNNRKQQQSGVSNSHYSYQVLDLINLLIRNIRQS